MRHDRRGLRIGYGDDALDLPLARAVIDDAMKKHMPSFRYEVTAHGEA